MKRFQIKCLVLSVATSTMLGCASNMEFTEEAKHKPLIKPSIPRVQPVRTSTYVREVSIKERLEKEVTKLAAKDMRLIEVLGKVLPGYQIVQTTPEVDLQQTVIVRQQQMRISDFISYIEGITGYTLKIDGKRIFVSSFVSDQWNMAAFSDSRSVNNRTVSIQSGSTESSSGGDGGDGGQSYNSIEIESDENEWTNLLQGAREILGIKEDEESDPESAPVEPIMYERMEEGVSESDLEEEVREPQEPYVHGIRSVGIITAAGPAYKMRELDHYFTSAIKSSQTVFNIQVGAYDVLLNEGKEKGVDWDLLVNGRINGNPFDVGLNKDIGETLSEGLFNVTGSYAGDRGSADFMVSFLRQFGEVELDDQPNITVRNGAPAKIYAGDEFSFIADFEQTTSDTGVATVTPKFERLKVGVTLAVTARLLEDDKILMDIWPVISRISGSDQFNVDGIQFETPRTSLKEFSTQVITTSGTPIHLGGLITKRITRALKGLPVENKLLKGILDMPFEEIDNDIERRELVLVVTPTIVEGLL